MLFLILKYTIQMLHNSNTYPNISGNDDLFYANVAPIPSFTRASNWSFIAIASFGLTIINVDSPSFKTATVIVSFADGDSVGYLCFNRWDLRRQRQSGSRSHRALVSELLVTTCLVFSGLGLLGLLSVPLSMIGVLNEASPHCPLHWQ